jgi:hypothetical protein
MFLLYIKLLHLKYYPSNNFIRTFWFFSIPLNIAGDEVQVRHGVTGIAIESNVQVRHTERQMDRKTEGQNDIGQKDRMTKRQRQKNIKTV